MKIAPMLIILYVILVGIILFDGLSTTPWTSVPYATSGSNYSDSSNETVLWRFFVDPSQWTSNTFFQILLASLAITGIAAAATFLTKSDIVLLSPIFILIINAGIIPIVSIFTVVHREIWRMICTSSLSTSIDLRASCGSTYGQSILITSIIVGPIAIAWVLACIEWWTQRPTS